VELLLILTLLSLFAVAALNLGVDSRDGSPDSRRSVYPTGLR
jgi:hypothetical protein